MSETKRRGKTISTSTHLDPELKAWIDEYAERNKRSTSQMIALLIEAERARVEAEEKWDE